MTQKSLELINNACVSHSDDHACDSVDLSGELQEIVRPLLESHARLLAVCLELASVDNRLAPTPGISERLRVAIEGAAK